MISKQVCFTVTGEGLTRLSRRLWADEGEPEKALHILQAAFPKMPQSDIFDILTGKQRIGGDSNRGMMLRPDDEPVSEYGNDRALEAVLKKFRDQADEGKDWMQMATGQTAFVPSPKGLVEVPRRRTGSNSCNMRRFLDADLNNIPYKESHVTGKNLGPREQETEETPPSPPPSPERSITTGTGWLSPDGKFYSCQYGGHDELAFRLGQEEYKLERMGWVKLQEGAFLWNFSEHFEPTQRQIDLVFDYCQATGIPMPNWTN